nr:hypothetical protein [Agrobacterium sp. MA01]
MSDGIQSIVELCGDRQAQKLRIFARALLRHELDAIAKQVAPTKLYKVRSPDTEVHHQLECQSRRRPKWIDGAKPIKFDLAPRMETV